MEAILYYNPLKLFLLFSLICLVSALMMAVSFHFAIVSGVILAVGTAMVSVIIFGMGLLAVLLK